MFPNKHLTDDKRMFCNMTLLIYRLIVLIVVKTYFLAYIKCFVFKNISMVCFACFC